MFEIRKCSAKAVDFRISNNKMIIMIKLSTSRAKRGAAYRIQSHSDFFSSLLFFFFALVAFCCHFISRFFSLAAEQQEETDSGWTRVEGAQSLHADTTGAQCFVYLTDRDCHAMGRMRWPSVILFSPRDTDLLGGCSFGPFVYE